MSSSRLALVALSLIATAMMSAATPAPIEAQHRGDVEICHHAGPTKTLTLHVSPQGAAQHIANHDGDTYGACYDGPPPTDS